MLCALSILSLTGYCFAQSQSLRLKGINQTLLWVTSLTMSTGALLVHPKHFSFHTPWIQAAILLSSTYLVGLFLLILYPPKKRGGLMAAYLLLWTLMVLITHDAVNKTTFISLHW